MRNNERKDPGDEQDTEPAGPSHNSVAVHMHRVAKDAEEDEASRDRSIQASQENQGWNHEGEGGLLVNIIQRSKSGSSHVLVASVGVDDSANNGKDDDFANGAGPERLGKFPAYDVISILCFERKYIKSFSPGISHLSNETGECNLADKGIADIQKGAHGVDECSSLDGESGDNW